MSVRTIITQGFGTFGTIADVIMRGFTSQAVVDTSLIREIPLTAVLEGSIQLTARTPSIALTAVANSSIKLRGVT